MTLTTTKHLTDTSYKDISAKALRWSTSNIRTWRHRDTKGPLQLDIRALRFTLNSWPNFIRVEVYRYTYKQFFI